VALKTIAPAKTNPINRFETIILFSFSCYAKPELMLQAAGALPSSPRSERQ
jgi:hypothetical protein